MSHIYKGWIIAPNGSEWSYRKNRSDMWHHAYTLSEAMAAIDFLISGESK